MNTVFATESRFSVKNSEPLYIALPAYSSWQHLEITSGETYKHWSGLTLTLKPIGLEKRLTLFKMLHYFLSCHVRLGHRRSWRSAHFISSLLRKCPAFLIKNGFHCLPCILEISFFDTGCEQKQKQPILCDI